MKTRELIKLLNEVDPSGEIEVCSDNEAIIYVEIMPAYYDGSLQILNENEEGSIVSGIIRRSGTKIKLISYPLEDAVLDRMVSHFHEHGNTDYEFPIEVIGDTYLDKPKNSYTERIKAWHDEARSIIEGIKGDK